jgi:hypothetical protein
MIDFAAILRDGKELRDMPPFTIDDRSTDVFVTYNKQKTRLDRIAGDIYSDATCWRFILWANPEYFIEFDIPDNTQIRVPFPLNDVQFEVIEKIELGRNREIV